MFITTTPDRRLAAERSLSWLAARLPDPPPPVHVVELGDHVIAWSGTQPNQNLHVFEDGAVLGLLTLGEPPSTDPIHHAGPVVTPPSPITATVVRRDRGTVEPQGITNVFFSDSAASDRQLLLAIVDDLRPSPVGVALLTGPGYLPGDETLFAGTSRVPLGHRLELRDGSVHRARRFSLPSPDDDAMVERLASLVVDDGHHTIGLTGGLDSRFVLGVLAHRGIAPVVARFDEGEEGEREIVESIVRSVDLPERSAGRIAQADRRRTPLEQVVLTDAQIYARVPQWGQLREVLAPTDVFHTGHFGDFIIKNWFASAWKKPDPRRDIWEAMLAGLAANSKPTEPALRSVATRRELVEHLRSALAYQRDYLELRTQKQVTNWFGYINRGIRWSPALVGDLCFSANPVFLLGDVDAQLLGIATSAWSNFHDDRARHLNQRLLPAVTAGYAGGTARTPRRGPAGAVDKLRYEYIARLQVKRELTALLKSQNPTYVDELPANPVGWDDLFTVEPADAVANGSTAFKRGALAVALVLDLLATARRELASA